MFRWGSGLRFLISPRRASFTLPLLVSSSIDRTRLRAWRALAIGCGSEWVSNVSRLFLVLRARGVPRNLLGRRSDMQRAQITTPRLLKFANLARQLGACYRNSQPAIGQKLSPCVALRSRPTWPGQASRSKPPPMASRGCLRVRECFLGRTARANSILRSGESCSMP